MSRARPFLISFVAHVALAVLALLSASAGRAQGVQLVDNLVLPSPLGHAAGVTFDGQSIWVAALRTSGDPASADELIRLTPDGAVLTTVIGGPSRVLQKVASDGKNLWAIEMYDELHRLDDFGQTVEDFSIPFSHGLAGDPTAERLFLLEGSNSDEIHVLENGSVSQTLHTGETHAYWWGLAYDGCTLWTADGEDDELHRIHPSTGAILETMPAPTSRVAGLGFDGRDLLLTDTTMDVVMRAEVSEVYVDGVPCTPGFAWPDPSAPTEEPTDEPTDPTDPTDATDEPADEPTDTTDTTDTTDSTDDPGSQTDPATDDEPADEGPAQDEGEEGEETLGPPLDDPQGSPDGFEGMPGGGGPSGNPTTIQRGCACVSSEAGAASGFVALLGLVALASPRRRRRGWRD
jgi:MYXO-CTERM domain-containing protein